jgi:hypothetical protein
MESAEIIRALFAIIFGLIAVFLILYGMSDL